MPIDVDADPSFEQSLAEHRVSSLVRAGLTPEFSRTNPRTSTSKPFTQDKLSFETSRDKHDNRTEPSRIEHQAEPSRIPSQANLALAR